MKDKNNRKVRDHCHCTGKYRDAAHSICSLKYGVPKEIPLVFHNGSNYDYHLIIKHLAEELKKQFICLGKSTEIYITFTVPIEKEVTKLIKMLKKLQKIYLPYYNFLIVQDLWQAHYQIFSIIFLKEFIELNVNLDTVIKNVKHVKLNISIATVFSNIQTLKMI